MLWSYHEPLTSRTRLLAAAQVICCTCAKALRKACGLWALQHAAACTVPQHTASHSSGDYGRSRASCYVRGTAWCRRRRRWCSSAARLLHTWMDALVVHDRGAASGALPSTKTTVLTVAKACMLLIRCLGEDTSQCACHLERSGAHRACDISSMLMCTRTLSHCGAYAGEHVWPLVTSVPQASGPCLCVFGGAFGSLLLQ